MYKLSFELTSKILNMSIEITQSISKFSYNKETNLLLRKASKIKSIYSTCAIDTSKLNEEEVTSIINNENILAPRSEIIEVNNCFLVYDNIDKYDCYKEQSILDVHQKITEQLHKESGIYRNSNNTVVDNTEISYKTDSQNIIEDIKKLFELVSKSELNPLIKAAILHCELEYIHPFKFDNSKISRFWQSLVLYKYNAIFEYIPVESLIYENQKRFNEVLSITKTRGNATLFVEFILEMIIKTIDKMNYIDVKIKNEYYTLLSKTEKYIINVLVEYLNNVEFITVDIAVTLLNKNKDNVRKYFGILVKQNLLIPIGENKGRIYVLNKEILE